MSEQNKSIWATILAGKCCYLSYFNKCLAKSWSSRFGNGFWRPFLKGQLWMLKLIFIRNLCLIYIKKCLNLVLFKQQPLKFWFTYHTNDSKFEISSIGAPCRSNFETRPRGLDCFPGAIHFERVFLPNDWQLTLPSNLPAVSRRDGEKFFLNLILLFFLYKKRYFLLISLLYIHSISKGTESRWKRQILIYF